MDLAFREIFNGRRLDQGAVRVHDEDQAEQSLAVGDLTKGLFVYMTKTKQNRWHHSPQTVVTRFIAPREHRCSWLKAKKGVSQTPCGSPLLVYNYSGSSTLSILVLRVPVICLALPENLPVICLNQAYA